MVRKQIPCNENSSTHLYREERAMGILLLIRESDLNIGMKRLQQSGGSCALQISRYTGNGIKRAHCPILAALHCSWMLLVARLHLCRSLARHSRR